MDTRNLREAISVLLASGRDGISNEGERGQMDVRMGCDRGKRVTETLICRMELNTESCYFTRLYSMRAWFVTEPQLSSHFRAAAKLDNLPDFFRF
ncbi:hypothetical protein EVAR_77566_1 [Eumeta japonica]|uniref:Uncharacterized protein n=1 Tax=Eumeta variegata TaxID=151549 RepID=A0A4C1T9R2_EUMVA|nr:hypothetical protein EVAR_77566_1 [Eumeta japonica]